MIKKLALLLAIIPTVVFAQTSAVGVKVHDLTRDSSPSRTDEAYSIKGTSPFAPRKVFWGDIVDLTGWTITGSTITTTKDVTTTGTVTAAHFSGDGTGLTGTGAVPAGSGSELQYRGSASALGALSGSSVSGSNVTFGGTVTATTALKVGSVSACLSDGTNCPAASGNGMTDDGTVVHLTTNTDNLGVGTTTASTKLTVSGDVTATAYHGDGSALTGIGSGAGGWTDDGPIVHLTGSTDNIGIGTTAAPTKVNVLGTVTATAFAGPITGAVTGNVTGTVTGNASTATALAANGNNCTAPQFPLGVDASGVAEGCTTLIRPTDIDTSGELANILTDETGTGSVVFSANPRFTGNIGVGSTAPGVTLDINGTVRATSFIGLAGVSGWTASTGKVITTTSTDNVGIGTSLPTALLDVGLAHAFQVDSNGYLILNGGATPSITTFGQLTSDNNAWASGRGAPVFYDGTAATYLIGALVSDIPSDGQVPTWHTGGVVTWDTPSSGSGGSITAADTQVIFSDGANNPVGNVGITYNKTSALLTVTGGYQAGASQYPSVGFPASSTDSDWIMGVKGSGGTDDDNFSIGVGTTMPDALVKVTIGRGGNLGIGSTSPNNNLDVNGTAQATLFKMTQSPIRGASLISNDAVGIGTWMTNVINVRSYGATGDGTTDDTSAIQAAMTAAAGNGILYFPKPATYYKITSALRLASNLTIRGDNSKIHMPAQANENSMLAMFDTNNGATTSNVDISGLYVESVNSTTGTGNNNAGYYDGATTSFVMGFNLHNTSDIRIHDCTLDALAYGFKIDTTLNTHLFFNNLKIINTGTNIYGSNITDAYFSNMYLDSTSYTATNGHLHNFYFETTVQDIYFNNVSMNNTAGGCMQIYQSGGTAAKNIQGKNLTCNTAADMFIIWTGTKDVRIDGWRAKGVTKILNIDDAHNVQLSHGYVELKQYLIDTSSATSDHITIDNLIMDASTKTADAGDFIQGEDGGGSYYTLQNSSFYGITANNRVVYNSAAAFTNLRITNNDFYFSATPADNPVSLRNASTTAIVNGNRFINQGTATTNAVIHAPITLGQVTASSNTATGFPKMTSGSDTATIATNNFVNGVGTSLDTTIGNIGIGTWKPTAMFDVARSLLVTSGGNIGIGSINPTKTLDLGPSASMRVGIGTTVAQQLCKKADGTLGYFNGAWTSTCN